MLAAAEQLPLRLQLHQDQQQLLHLPAVLLKPVEELHKGKLKLDKLINRSQILR